MYKGKKVSVVFPAYNEERGIAAAVRSFVQQEGVDEVVVVDNNSRDQTRALAEEAGGRVVTETRQGYGFALQRGLAEAAGDLIILCEPDGTFLAADVEKLLAYSTDFEMVLGTRTNRELIWESANMRWFLRTGNLAVAKMQEFLFNGPALTDCGCTMRLVHRTALDRFRSQLTVGASHFLPEMVILALKARVKLIEIPLNYCGRIGESKITGSWKGTLKTGFNMIFLIIRYRLGFPPQP